MPPEAGPGRAEPERAPAARWTERWQQKSTLTALLGPVALLYGWISAARRQAYRWGWRKTLRLPCRVLVVGNVIVGGAGKTPTVIALTHYFRTRGWQVGIISRGYGRQNDATLEVRPSDAATDVGDEPLLLVRATQVPVFVARRRYQAAAALLARYPETDLIICDDGLQHLELYRDLELCLFDDRGVGNGWLLPAGPLREPWPRHWVAAAGQSTARSLVLHTGRSPSFAGYRAQRQLASYAQDAHGNRIPLADFTAKRPLLALAGIAQPAVFFADLRAAGLRPDDTLSLPDHADFSALNLSPWQSHTIICTEKDAVKLWPLRPDALAVPLLQSMDPALLEQLHQLLQSQRDARI